MSAATAKILCETVPGLLFFFVYALKLQLNWGGVLWSPLYTATAVLMATTLPAVIISRLLLKKWSAVLIVTTVVVLLFGGLTLFFNDSTFIKIKPTIINSFFAIGLWGSVLCKRPAVRLLLGDTVPLTSADTRLLTLRWAGFFAALAVTNEIIRHFGTDDLWVWWKTWGALLCGVPFMLWQWPLLQRGLEHEQSLSSETTGRNDE